MIFMPLSQFVAVWLIHSVVLYCTERDFLFDVHFVDLENFQPLARFKVQKFAEVKKIVLGFKNTVQV